MSLRDFQRAFIAAVTSEDDQPLKALLVDPGASLQRRISIYRNNVWQGALRPLQANFPVVARLVGEECFAAAVRAFIGRQRSQEATLVGFGAKFPDFLRCDFPPVAGLSYLGDVAQLEYAWVLAYHTPKAAPLTAEALATMAPEDLPEMRFTLHPAIHLLSSPFPVDTIWAAHQQDDVPELVLDPGFYHIVIGRPQAQVMVTRLTDGEAAWLAAAAQGKTLTQMTQEAQEKEADFDLERAFVKLLPLGVFASC